MCVTECLHCPPPPSLQGDTTRPLTAPLFSLYLSVFGVSVMENMCCLCTQCQLVLCSHYKHLKHSRVKSSRTEGKIEAKREEAATISCDSSELSAILTIFCGTLQTCHQHNEACFCFVIIFNLNTGLINNGNNLHQLSSCIIFGSWLKPRHIPKNINNNDRKITEITER